MCQLTVAITQHSDYKTSFRQLIVLQSCKRLHAAGWRKDVDKTSQIYESNHDRKSKNVMRLSNFHDTYIRPAH